MNSSTWIEIVTDPQHLIADFIMNTVYEVILVLLIYRVMYKKLYKRIAEKTAHRAAKINGELVLSAEPSDYRCPQCKSVDLDRFPQ